MLWPCVCPSVHHMPVWYVRLAALEWGGTWPWPHAGIVSKRPHGLSQFLAHIISSTYHTVCLEETQVAQKIRSLLLEVAPDFGLTKISPRRNDWPTFWVKILHKVYAKYVVLEIFFPANHLAHTIDL